MIVSVDQMVREIVINQPGSVRIFETLGIDYRCGRERSLKEACERSGVPLDNALGLLSMAVEQPSETTNPGVGADLKDLVRHIVERHHGYVRRESPRLVSMIEKVLSARGGAHPELKSIQESFLAMANDLFAHMMKEENVLFPYLVRMEAAVHEGRPMPPAMFGSVEAPISRMLADHDNAGALAARIRALSANYLPPEGACPTYIALYQGLEEFERDLHQHVHLENNIVFPRALEMEREEIAHAGR